MRLIALGVGDAFSARWYSSCLALEAQGFWLLIDCPHPIRKMLREGSGDLSLDLFQIRASIVTHLHADHCSGLEGLGYFSYFATGKRASLYAHPLVLSRLWDGHLAAGMEALLASPTGQTEPKTLHSYFDTHPLDDTQPISVGPFSVECRRTIHHIPTTALKLRADGRTLGYSADTAFDPSLIEWLSDADLLIHETNYGIHTPYEKLAELPSELRAKMRLIHYPDGFDLQGSCIKPLAQGEICEV